MKHNRQSIRLKNYDYSQANTYFITIVVQDKLRIFGHIANGDMYLNTAGEMIKYWYFSMEDKFPEIRLHQYVIMSDHAHFIIEKTESSELHLGRHVGLPQRVYRVY